MASWSEFEAGAPEIAEKGRWLLAQNGGVCFLATVRKSGAPDIHPVMPLVAEGGLYVFIVNMSGKHEDLLRDGRYALHAIPAGEENRELLLAGRAQRVDDVELRKGVVKALGWEKQDWETLFELGIERALSTTWTKWGTAETMPQFARWSVRKGLSHAD